jgi:hypothetical protein
MAIENREQFESLPKSQESLEQTLEKLEEIDKKLCEFVDTYLASEGLSEKEKNERDALTKELCIGHKMPFYGERDGGLKNEECEAAFSRCDNMEGSLYAKFGENGVNILRFRWGGSDGKHIYLNENGKEETFVVSRPNNVWVKRLNGLEIEGREENTLTARTPQDMRDWVVNTMQYSWQIKEWEKLMKSKIRCTITKLLKGSLPEKPVEPKRSEPIRIPVSAAVETVQKLINGLRKMLNLLEQKRKEFANSETESS